MLDLAYAIGLGFKSAKQQSALRGLMQTEALAGLSTNIMIADKNYNIVYANEAVIAFLKSQEGEMRKDFPSFDAYKLVGMNIDFFHKDPHHQRGMLDRMTNVMNTSIKVGGLVFNLRAFPIFDEMKNRIGTVVEWQDSLQMDALAQMSAIDSSMATIEFNTDGTIISANKNFLSVMGYSLDEIQGKHHRMFVDPDEANTIQYREFWEALARGEYQQAEYKRFGKNGKIVWIQASYNPIFDLNNRPFKVVKYASDVSHQVLMRIRNEKIKNIITENISEIENAISSASDQSSSAANSSVETSSTVQSIAAGAEEMNSSVEEIAQSMAISKVSVDEAFDQTMAADKATQMLTNAAQSMGGIVELIQAIASQINLLALNATIESARAGDAGKGFAVVANEVKNLAMQTTTATEQISKEIDNMQSISSDVVKSLSVIKESIEAVRKNVTGVASAVSEQSAVTQEMSANMQSAATAVANISNNLGRIAKSTENAQSSAQKIMDAIHQE